MTERELSAETNGLFWNATRWYLVLGLASAANVAIALAGVDQRAFFELVAATALAEVGQAIASAVSVKLFALVGAIGGWGLSLGVAAIGWAARRTYGTNTAWVVCIVGVVVLALDTVLCVVTSLWPLLLSHAFLLWQFSVAAREARRATTVQPVSSLDPERRVTALSVKSGASGAEASTSVNHQPANTVTNEAWEPIETLWRNGHLGQAIALATDCIQRQLPLPTDTLREMTRAGLMGGSTRSAAGAVAQLVGFGDRRWSLLRAADRIAREKLTNGERLVQSLVLGAEANFLTQLRELSASHPTEVLRVQGLLTSFPELADLAADVDTRIISERRRPSYALQVVIGAVIVFSYAFVLHSVITDDPSRSAKRDGAKAEENEPPPLIVGDPAQPALCSNGLQSTMCRIGHAVHLSLDQGDCARARRLLRRIQNGKWSREEQQAIAALSQRLETCDGR